MIIPVVVLLLLQLFPACRQSSEKEMKADRRISDSAYLVIQKEIQKKGNKFTPADSIMWRRRVDSLFPATAYRSRIDSCIYYLLLADIVWHGDDNLISMGTRLVYFDSALLCIRRNKLEKELYYLYKDLLGYRASVLLTFGRLDEAAENVNEKIYLRRENANYSQDEKGLDMRYLEDIYFRQRKYNKVLELCRQILALFNNYHLDRYGFFNSQRALDDIGLAYRLMKKYDSSLIYHFAAENFILTNRHVYDQFDSLFSYKALMNIYSNIATDYLLTGKPDSAVYYCSKALQNKNDKLNDVISNKEEIAGIASELNTKLAIAWYMKGNIDSAVSAIQQARKDISLTNKSIQLRYLKLLSSLDSSKGNYAGAISNLYQYMRLKEGEMKGALTDLNADPQFLYNKLVNQYELEKKNQLISIQRVRTRGAIRLAAVMMIFALVLFLSYRKLRQVMSRLKKTMKQVMIRQKQKEEEELRYQELRLHIRHQEAIAGQRREISNNLHDSLSGSLVALRYYIEDLKYKTAQELHKATFDNIGAEVESIYMTTRQYMHDLNTGKIHKQHDLYEQLAELAGKFGTDSVLKIGLDIPAASIREQLDIYQQDQLYYIINEAVSNVLKYANASACGISISFSNGICFFSVTDNGRGFDKTGIKEGLGMGSIRSRIRNLEGKIILHTDNRGTTIRGQFPVQRQKINTDQR